MQNLFDELFHVCVMKELQNAQQLAEYLNKTKFETVDIIRDVNSATNKVLFTEVKAKLFLDDPWFNDAYYFQEDEQKAEYAKNRYVTNYGQLLKKLTINKFDREFEKYIEIEATAKGKTAITSKYKNDGIASIKVGGNWVSLIKLVATHFLANPHNKKRVKCKNGNTYDAHPMNLYWY